MSFREAVMNADSLLETSHEFLHWFVQRYTIPFGEDTPYTRFAEAVMTRKYLVVDAEAKEITDAA